jgi:SAM-dependent methyltransferase
MSTTRALPDALDLGCGLAKHPGAFGVDHDPAASPDLLHDLDRYPIPLPSDHFQVVFCQDVIEHIREIEPFLREIHRICRKGARVHVRTPHYTSWYAYNDPTHRHALGYFALDRFTDTPGVHARSTPLFRYVSRRILFPRAYRLLGAAGLANAFPARWEQMFAWSFPAENLLLEMEVLKEP